MQKIILYVLLAMTSFIAQSRAEQEQGNNPARQTIKATSDFQGLVKTPFPISLETTIDGTHFVATDKKIYVLPDIMIPEHTNIEPETKARLQSLMDNNRCTFYQTRTPDLGRINRMNQTIAHLECGKDKIWIEGQLVREGLAIVWPTIGNTELIGDLLSLENKARLDKIGLWKDDTIKIQDAESIKSHLNSKQIIQAKVYNASLTRDMLYLNFEQDWKKDFSIGIAPNLQREISRKNISLQSLKGQTIRVRGWVRDYNGPFIDLETIDQLEILETSQEKPTSNSKPGMKSISNPVTPTVESPQNRKHQNQKQ